jgi:NAD(P)-dependent dehydrogenase (short-subunit alcohol dehydrogenase family)
VSSRLDGRVAVITGAGSGIGLATAELFLLHGARVVAIELPGEGCERAAARLPGIELHPADVRDDAAIAAIAARYDRVDVLFANAGVIEREPTQLATATAADWHEIVDVNLRAVLSNIQAFVPALRRSSAGAIVLNGSVDGVFGNPHVPLYSISKGGLIPMTHVLAHELSPIRVNCITPAGIRTGMSGPMVDDAYREQLRRATPLQRWGEAAEVASVVLCLAGDDFSYVTGAVVPVDGGRTALTGGTA